PFLLLMLSPPLCATLFPYTTLFRSVYGITGIINFAFGEFYMLGAFAAVMVFLLLAGSGLGLPAILVLVLVASMALTPAYGWLAKDRNSTHLNSSHDQISYAVFCLKK